jgi:agmatinase
LPQHVGIRTGLMSWDDYENDWDVGFQISHAEDIEEVGYNGIVKKIREVVGDNPVYSAPFSISERSGTAF